MSTSRRGRVKLAGALMVMAVALVPAGMAAGPALAAQPEEPVHPWRAPHWPQEQPWQRDAPSEEQLDARAMAKTGVASRPDAPAPIDPQNWKNPDNMTWNDYKGVPGTNWADPAAKGSKRTFKGALVLADYPNMPFVVTQPPKSTVFGNPSTEAHSIPREQVAQFYKDFLNTPNALNRGHTVHEYWMEGSGGRYGVELTAFGPYELPGKSHEYAMEMQAGTGCPAGDACNKNIRTDTRAKLVADVGEERLREFDFIFYLSAGQDESATWQEFGPIKFKNKEDVTDEFGPPDPALPNWVRTRYVEWTSWASGSTIWPNAGGGSSTQAESSGQGVYAHELSHILGIGDNYNNPFGIPARRAYTGIWEMLSRGSFNGPGGPHSRWVIPPTAGGSMGAQHMLRNKIKLEMVDEKNVLRLSREALAESGLVVAKVVARSAPPGEKGLAGVNIELATGDKSPACSVQTDPFCDGGAYNNYTVEVVDRMGSDSFTPDSGVLLAKTKNQDRAPFEWVIDANPQDIRMVDFVRPDGTKEYITIGDYRQLSDALFHAGTNSGSEYEYVDEANRLHFYVLDLKRDRTGVLSYTVAIRSLDGAGVQRRGVKVLPTVGVSTSQRWAKCVFPLVNTGKKDVPAGQHPEGDISEYASSDVYRLSATVEGRGWETLVPNALKSAKAGELTTVVVHANRDAGGSRTAKLKLTAVSESDPTKKSEATCTLIGF
ncbi:M6 family metalloprotease domain-containing protein [Rhizohabitans arisaemae]|uniref:M6 family metalloprotease domain-containing protein n=1 Tax=Rhizohabitans arisaemae TaxID=2720610 RepID=UPI0024B20BEA|nr:M6 family metalloprotease domain-containing protein [Rhizohabitans arisaemae]